MRTELIELDELREKLKEQQEMSETIWKDRDRIRHELIQLRALSELLLNAIVQKEFFMEGYGNGSASISEVIKSRDDEHQAYSNLYDAIEKAKKQNEP